MSKILSIFAVLFAPLSALAQGTNPGLNPSGTSGSGTTLYTYLGDAVGLLQYAVPVLFTLAIVFFFYEVFRYMIAGSGEQKDESKKMVVYSIIGLVVMFSVYGIIRVIQNTFGLGGDNTSLPTPGIPRQ